MKTVLQSLINASIIIICLFFTIINLTQCANIFAELDMVAYCTDQRSLCQNTGSFIHIVCEYYGKIGSSCSMFSEVPLDDNHEDDILRRINSMRAQAARAKTIGKGQQKLPRAYGLKKVFWDSELAAFAKIMINQCISKHRYSCAASKNFASPMMVYAFANTTSSATAIIENIFSSFEADALNTTPDEILHSPDLKGGEPRPFIKMMVGDVTHVGCAAGIYEHEIRPIAIKANDNIKLSGHIICYLSHYSREGTPVYNTTEPISGTWWTKCGCPPMYRETRDCLCVPVHASERTTKRPTAIAITRENMTTTTTSTQVYYDNFEKYMQYIYNIESPQMTGPAEKTQLLDLTTKKPLESTPQQNLEWSPKETLDPRIQQRLEPAIRQKLEAQSAVKLRTGDGTPKPTCKSGVRCEPKIVMLPIFTIENAPKPLSRRNHRGYYRRSSNTSSLPNAEAIDYIRFSDENYDELPQNTSIRSKVLETVNKIRQKQAADIFSNENAEHGKPNKINKNKDHKEIKPSKPNKDHKEIKPSKPNKDNKGIKPFMPNKDHSRSTVKTTKRSVKPITSTVQPSHPTTNKRSHNDAKKSVMNLLELLEKQEKIVEPTHNVAEPSQPITNKRSRDNRNEKAKKRVMHLLDLLEEKGRKAQLNSREMIEFDAKMRRIYTSVLGTTRKSDFIKLWDF